MFAPTRLFAAVATLAANVEALAGSIAEANANFRQRLALDVADPAPLLEHQPEASASPATPARRGKRQAA
jgi:hypothetical protein